jgi:hypothetical protein
MDEERWRTKGGGGIAEVGECVGSKEWEVGDCG